jgi:hypothetical protein
VKKEVNKDISKYFLTVQLSGKPIGPGRVPVSLLMRLFSEFNKALHRTGMVFLGEAESVKRGPRQRSIRDEIALDLVLLTHGSPDAVLGFERSPGQQAFDGIDFGVEIIEKSLQGLAEIQGPEEGLPFGFDAGTLLAWRDVGILFEHGVDKILFSLNHRSQGLATVYSEPGYRRVQERIKGPQTNIRTIEGRLLMADFKEHGTRCRVHPSIGEPVICLFDEVQKDEVLENILSYVKVIGEAKEDPITGKINSIKIQDIQRLEDREEGVDLLPRGTPLPMNFWESPGLDQLVELQGTHPLTDVTSLFGTWPGDPDDGFEETVRTVRMQTNFRG